MLRIVTSLTFVISMLAHGSVSARRARPVPSASYRIDVRMGSCSAQLESSVPWRRHADGSFSTTQRMVILMPRGSQLRLPMLSTAPVRVHPNRLSFPLDARLLPIPKGGLFGELMARADLTGPVSAGLDTGAHIRRRVPNLALNPKTTYFYFTATHPFSINLDKRNRNKSRTNTSAKRNRRKPRRKIITTGFALDPCDPAVFFGGVGVTVAGVAFSLDGIGFSRTGNVHAQSDMPMWTGRTQGNGQPELRSYRMKGHAYLRGGVGIGIGKFLSITGNIAATVNLDPKRDGVWGLQEAISLFKGRLPRTIPDFTFLIEGSPSLNLAGMSIPFAKAAIALDASNPRRVRVSIAGQRGPALSLAALFPGTPPPGAQLIRAKSAIQVFANAIFDAHNPRPNGSYQAKLRGVLELGPWRVAGDVDISYRVGGRATICVKVPTMARLCGPAIENAIANLGKNVARAGRQVGKAAVESVLAANGFFKKAGKSMDASFGQALKALGKAAEDGFHNFHGAPKCTRESKRLGRQAGTRLRNQIAAQAQAFFRTVRPKLRGLPPHRRAAATKRAYQRFHKTAVAKQRHLDRRGRAKAARWSVNPHFQRQYSNAYSAAFRAALGNIRRLLGDVYRRRENVGQPWR